MACEINHVLPQVELLIHVPHGGRFRVHALKGFGVIFVKISHKNQELPEPSFLKHAHQICAQTEKKRGLLKKGSHKEKRIVVN